MEYAKNAEGQFPGHRPGPSLSVIAITLLRSHPVLISAPRATWPGTLPIGFVKWKLWFCDKCPGGTAFWRQACMPLLWSSCPQRGPWESFSQAQQRQHEQTYVHLPIDSFTPQILTEHLLYAVPMLDLGMQRWRSHNPSSSGQGHLHGQWPFSDHCFGRMKLEVEGD